MMTLYQFNLLPEPEQMATLSLIGHQIGERTEASYFITLFQVEAFYVEIWQIASTKDFYKVRSFVSTEQLKSYLDQIDIRDLIQS